MGTCHPMARLECIDSVTSLPVKIELGSSRTKLGINYNFVKKVIK